MTLTSIEYLLVVLRTLVLTINFCYFRFVRIRILMLTSFCARWQFLLCCTRCTLHVVALIVVVVVVVVAHFNAVAAVAIACVAAAVAGVVSAVADVVIALIANLLVS